MLVYFIPFIVAAFINIRRIGYESELMALRNNEPVNPIKFMFSHEATRLYRPKTGRTAKEKELIRKSNICSFLTWGIIIGTILFHLVRLLIFLNT